MDIISSYNTRENSLNFTFVHTPFKHTPKKFMMTQLLLLLLNLSKIITFFGVFLNKSNKFRLLPIFKDLSALMSLSCKKINFTFSHSANINTKQQVGRCQCTKYYLNVFIQKCIRTRLKGKKLEILFLMTIYKFDESLSPQMFL